MTAVVILNKEWNAAMKRIDKEKAIEPLLGGSGMPALMA
jgi:hypothetical protein